MKIQCYNCGKYFDKKETNKEHIPAKGLFKGYPDNYKDNRLTVRSCISCNRSYSKDDEEFRNMIGIMNSKKERITLSEKSAKSIVGINKQLNRIVSDIKGNIGVEFAERNIDRFHIKNFKGIFYHEYGFSVPEQYITNTIKDFDMLEKQELLYNYLSHNFKWKISGHRDVFGYIIQPLRKITEQFVELKPDENDKIILACMEYNNSHTALVVAAKH